MLNDMMSALPLASARLSKLCIQFPNHLLMEVYVKKSQFPYFLFFLVFIHDFFIYIDFINIAASNMATDDVTNCHTWTIWYTLTTCLCLF